MNLTKSKIDAVRYEGRKIKNKQGQTRWTRDVRWDDKLPGFGLRITPNNRKSFVLSYRVNGQKRLIALGEFGTLTVDKARDLAIKRKAEILDGGDPIKNRREARKKSPTAADLADHYIEHYLPNKRPSSRVEDKYMIGRWVKPALGKLEVAEVKQVDG